MGTLPLHVTLLGAGQVGRALARALGEDCTLRAARRSWPKQAFAPGLLLLCVRDSQLPDVVARLATEAWRIEAVGVAHVSGVQSFELLAPLRPFCSGIAQAHPLLSITAAGGASFEGASLLVEGQGPVVVRLKRLARRLGARFVDGHGVDRQLYHAAAALLANGLVALFDTSSSLLAEAGVPGDELERLLVPLAQSVVNNVARQGSLRALTGPVRRGDASTIERHLKALAGRPPGEQALYRAAVAAQLRLARELGEARPAELRRIAELVRKPRSAR